MGINRERLSYGIYLYFISLYFDPYKRLCLLLRCNSPQTKLNKVTLPNIIAVRVTAHCNIAYSGIFSQNISPCLYITGSFYILFLHVNIFTSLSFFPNINAPAFSGNACLYFISRLFVDSNVSKVYDAPSTAQL